MITREQIKEYECPTCGAGAGQQCVYMGRGAAKKMRQGSSHLLRMEAAQFALDEEWSDLLVIDSMDPPERWSCWFRK